MSAPLPSKKPLPATSWVATAVGAAALGALAIGALSIGRMAVGRLAIGRLKVGKLEVDELAVRKLSVLPPFDVIPEGAKRLSGTSKRQMVRAARKLRRR